MGQKLSEIAQKLKETDKKVQLIYAFNGVGKTRLSREFKELIAPKLDDTEDENLGPKILYYNAFTEDLFYWDNDLEADSIRKLKIQPNNFTNWILKEQGQDKNITTNFQHYTSNKLTPTFNENFDEITFSIDAGNDERIDNIKISKGEESCLIWCVFYSLLEQIIEILKNPEPTERDNNTFDNLEYVFIDDPVSSLDDNHLIELAVNLANLIDSNQNEKPCYVITTHSPLFYNILFNELNRKKRSCFLLSKNEDNTYNLQDKPGDSNTSFSYHLHLKEVIENAIYKKTIRKYHFMLLRNLYEKTANFLGYPKWQDLLPNDNREAYYKRIVQFSSHSSLSIDEISEPNEQEKEIVQFLLSNLLDKNIFYKTK